MEVEVGPDPSEDYKNCVSGFWMCNFGNFNQSGLKKLNLCYF